MLDEFRDKTLKCICNKEFVFTAGEQAFFNKLGFNYTSERCPGCREAIARARVINRRIFRNFEFRRENSNVLDDFIYEITHVNRIPLNQVALKMINDIASNPTTFFERGSLFFRARIITDDKEINREKNFVGYSSEDSFVPPDASTQDMRANYKFIPYLYCSNHPMISLCETRPLLYSKVSMATIMVNSKLKIFDLTTIEEYSLTKEKKSLLFALSALFSKPIKSSDDITTYLPTQYIAEMIKKLGYDGIRYFSSFANDDNDSDQENFVIFSYNKCYPLNSTVINVKKIEYKGELDGSYSNLPEIFNVFT